MRSLNIKLFFPKRKGCIPIHHQQVVYTFLHAWDVISNSFGFLEKPTSSVFLVFLKYQEVEKLFTPQVLGSIRVAELQMRQLFPNILSGKSFHNNGNHMKALRVAPPTIEKSFQLSGLHIGLHK